MEISLVFFIYLNYSKFQQQDFNKNLSITGSEDTCYDYVYLNVIVNSSCKVRCEHQTVDSRSKSKVSSPQPVKDLAFISNSHVELPNHLIIKVIKNWSISRSFRGKKKT